MTVGHARPFLIWVVKWLGLALVGLAAGCAAPRLERPLVAGRDTFAFTNELAWAYHFNPATGRMEHQPRQPAPRFTNRCVPLAAAARKFFYHARFDPQQPRCSDQAYARLAGEVLRRSARRPSADGERVVIPGYANLFEFSAAQGDMLQRAVGGAWQSYLQRGNWRMVLPFRRAGQEKTFQRLRAALERNDAPIVHVVTFPRLTLNHTLLVCGRAAEGEARALLGEGGLAKNACYFKAYDPNTPGRPLIFWYDHGERRFYYPRTEYFAGGAVKVYEIFRGLCY